MKKLQEHFKDSNLLGSFVKDDLTIDYYSTTEHYFNGNETNYMFIDDHTVNLLVNYELYEELIKDKEFENILYNHFKERLSKKTKRNKYLLSTFIFLALLPAQATFIGSFFAKYLSDHLMIVILSSILITTIIYVLNIFSIKHYLPKQLPRLEDSLLDYYHDKFFQQRRREYYENHQVHYSFSLKSNISKYITLFLLAGTIVLIPTVLLSPIMTTVRNDPVEIDNFSDYFRLPTRINTVYDMTSEHRIDDYQYLGMAMPDIQYEQYELTRNLIGTDAFDIIKFTKDMKYGYVLDFENDKAYVINYNENKIKETIDRLIYNVDYSASLFEVYDDIVLIKTFDDTIYTIKNNRLYAPNYNNYVEVSYYHGEIYAVEDTYGYSRYTIFDTEFSYINMFTLQNEDIKFDIIDDTLYISDIEGNIYEVNDDRKAEFVTTLEKDVYFTKDTIVTGTSIETFKEYDKNFTLINQGILNLTDEADTVNATGWFTEIDGNLSFVVNPQSYYYSVYPLGTDGGDHMGYQSTISSFGYFISFLGCANVNTFLIMDLYSNKKDKKQRDAKKS